MFYFGDTEVEYTQSEVEDGTVERDIQRYVYCDNFNTQPYPGSYGQQPARWVQKSFIIKSEMNKATNKAIKDGK